MTGTVNHFGDMGEYTNNPGLHCKELTECCLNCEHHKGDCKDGVAICHILFEEKHIDEHCGSWEEIVNY